MKNIIRTFALAALTALAAVPVRGAVILQEDFTYADGSLTNLSAPKWTQHSGNTNDFFVESGRAAIGGNASPTRSADVNALFLNQPYGVTASNGAIYAKFEVELTTLPSAAGEYFAHFMPATFRARVWASTTGAASGKFKVGISHSTSTKTNLTEDFDLNTIYTFVVRIIPSTGVCTLWYNPVNENSVGVTPTDALVITPGITGFAMRQASGEGFVYLDNLVVATSFGDVVPTSAGSNPPFITVQPQGGSVSAGTAFSFTNTAGGDEPLTYQWRKDDVAISGANSRIYTIAATATGDTGAYTVVVTNTAGSITSSVANLTVTAVAVAPTITNQPASLTASWGQNATFSVGAGGTEPLTYQWRLDGTNITGATSAFYTRSSVFTNDAGPYTVVVTNVAGAITSTPAILTVTPPPVTNISYLRATVDSVNFAPTNTTTVFTAEGIVTTHQNLTAPTNALFYFQDATAGIACFWAGNVSADLPPAGARVRVTAPVSHFRGLLQFVPVAGNPLHQVTIISSNNPLPAPIQVPFSAKNDPVVMDALEGSYVVVSNVFIENPPPAFSGTMLITNNLSETFTLFVNASTDVAGQNKPLGPVTILGVLGQFDTANPLTEAYQLIPSRYADVISLAKSATVRFTNVLSNLVRPGQPTPNTFTEGVLRPGETLTMSVNVTDPEGGNVTITPLTAGLPGSASWITGATSGTNVNATFTFTPTSGDAGVNYRIALRTVNTFVTSTNYWYIYVPTPVEQQVFFTEFLANPTSDETLPHYNPLHRATIPASSITTWDEYVEIANLSTTEIDLYDWSVADAVGVRHRFYDGSISGETLGAQTAIIVYGGPANSDLPVLPVLSFPATESSAGLALNNTGTETLILRNGTNIIDRILYAGASLSSAGSMTRFPTLNSPFVAQNYVGTNTSAGVQYDGSGWTTPATVPSGVTPITVTYGNPVKLSYTGVTGQAYTLWQSDEANQPFAVVNGGIITNTAGAFFITNAPTDQQFYFITTP